MTQHDKWGGQQTAEHTYGTSDAGMDDLGMGEAARRRHRRWIFALPILAILALAAARMVLAAP
ncbi:hypothetical protein KZZ07_08195 [Mameliella sp. CS4]|uniref:hypothetical protein n=1 Tax=Mameliella sp. CS4 TaxID=2862329 RepID=UPI001C5ED789|nr:hypothetical protein [Mameliella sp. CS4]MBW4982518.1 hypothetical protein [Mameliella sp. CS4]